jgi:hypothetical protein
LYVNGTITPLYGEGPLNVQANSDPLRIGVDFSERYFNGTIDEVRIWNIARSTQQIRENMHLRLHGNESGLVSYYRFDEGSGTIAHDGSSGANSGTLVNSPTWVTATEPLGTGTSSSVTGFTNGSASLGNVTLSIPLGYGSPVDITASYITVPPDSQPLGSTTILNDRYWVISTYDVLTASIPSKSTLTRGRKGFGKLATSDLSLTFTVPSTFTNNGSASASLYTLYQRSKTSDGAWSTALDHGDSLNSTSVSFSGM